MAKKEKAKTSEEDASGGEISFEIDTSPRVTSLTFNQNGDVETEWSPEEKDSYEEYLNRTINKVDTDFEIAISGETLAEKQTNEEGEHLKYTNGRKKKEKQADEQDHEEDEGVSVEEQGEEQGEEQSDEEEADDSNNDNASEEEDDNEEVVIPQKKEISRSQKRVLESRKEVNEARQKQVESELKARSEEINKYKALEMVADLRAKNLKSDLAELTRQYESAIEDGDSRKQAELQVAISQKATEGQQIIENTKALKEGINQLEANFSQFKTEQTQKQNNSNVPPAAEEWLIGKEFLATNEAYVALPKEERAKAHKIRQAVKPLVQELLEEGFDPSDEIFYEEMDIRLEDKFSFYPELAFSNKEVLNSKNSTTSSEETIKTPTKKPNKTATEKAKSLPVSGTNPTSPKVSPSNNSPVVTRNGKQILKIKVSPEQRQIYNDYVKQSGISWDQYVTSIAREEGMI